ncbi:hypothetical protein JCM3765_001491 [Sporobolomyces pararoseus]
MESTQAPDHDNSGSPNQINSTRDQTSKPKSFPIYTAESEASQGTHEEAIEKGGAAEVESVQGGINTQEKDQTTSLESSPDASLALVEKCTGPSPQNMSLKRGPAGLYIWEVEEDKILLRAIAGNFDNSEGRHDYVAIDAALKAYWVSRGFEVIRSANSMKQRMTRLRAIQEIGLDPLSYVVRPWTAEEDAKVLALEVSMPAPPVEEDFKSTVSPVPESKNENDTSSPLPQTGYTLRCRPEPSRLSASRASSRPPVPSFLNSVYHYDYVPRKTSSRKRSNPDPSPPFVDSNKKRKRSSTPSTIASPPPPPTYAPPMAAPQGFGLVGIEVAREGIEILKTLRKQWEELGHEWDKVMME